MEVQDFSVLGREGLEVRLPFTYEQLKACNGDFRKELPGRLKAQYGSPTVTGPANLLPLFPEADICNGRYMPLLLVEEIVDGILTIKKIKKKEAHLVLFDGDSDYSFFLLSLFGKHYNYLTLVTEQLSRECEETIEQLFEEYGLVVSLREGPVTGELAGDVFFDATGAAKKYCRNLPKGCALIDLLGNNDRRYVESRIRDGMLCQSFLFGKEKEDGQVETYSPQVLEAVCFGADGQDPYFFCKNLWDCYHKIKEEGLRVAAINGEKVALHLDF